MILPRTAKNLLVTDTKEQAEDVSPIQEESQETVTRTSTIKDGADKGICEGRSLQEPYSHSSFPLLWSSETYVNDLMDMKRRVEDLEEKVQQDREKLQEVTTTS